MPTTDVNLATPYQTVPSYRRWPPSLPRK